MVQPYNQILLSLKKDEKRSADTDSRRMSMVKPAGTSLEIQWLRLPASNAGSTGSIPSQGNKIPHATWCGHKILETADHCV